jgi:hypothetical protein
MQSKQELINMRGLIVEECTKLEFLIDYYIIKHFTEDEEKQKEMQFLLLPSSRLIFSTKQEIFVWLLKKYNHQFLEANPIIKKIPDIISERNAFAHYPATVFDKPDGSYDRRLMKFKNKIEFIDKTREEFNQTMEEIYAVIDAIKPLIV